MKCCLARFGVVNAVGGDNPFEGLVADGESSAALAPSDAQLQEGSNAFCELGVSQYNLFLPVRGVAAGACRLLELETVFLGHAQEGASADAHRLRDFALSVSGGQRDYLFSFIPALLGAHIERCEG